ncbi:MAG: hypothetical protein AVDCRST_MAG26-1192, partial [uncultured Chloroflexia bacterium]
GAGAAAGRDRAAARPPAAAGRRTRRDPAGVVAAAAGAGNLAGAGARPGMARRRHVLVGLRGRAPARAAGRSARHGWDACVDRGLPVAGAGRSRRRICIPARHAHDLGMGALLPRTTARAALRAAGADRRQQHCGGRPDPERCLGRDAGLAPVAADPGLAWPAAGPGRAGFIHLRALGQSGRRRSAAHDLGRPDRTWLAGTGRTSAAGPPSPVGGAAAVTQLIRWAAAYVRSGANRWRAVALPGRASGTWRAAGMEL